jgi:hypothetical protein
MSIVNSSDKIENWQSPLSQAEVQYREYLESAINASVYRAKPASQCKTPPSTFQPSVSMQAQAAINRQQQGLTQNTRQLTPAVAEQTQNGAVISDDDIANAPQITPAPGQPTAQTVAITHRRRQRAARTQHQDIGTPWGSVAQPSPCTTGTLKDRLRANPWGTLFLATGLGVVVYAAMRK